MEKFEPKIDSPKNTEAEIKNIENKTIPEQKYINICESIGNDQEFLKQVCEKFNIHLEEGMKTAGIDFKALFEQKTGQKLEIA